MKNLSNNDIWILRTFAKLNQFTVADHVNPYEEMIALIKHINKMTYRNRATNLRWVYDFLRALSGEYKKGEASFNQFYKTGETHRTVIKISARYFNEIEEVTKE